MSMRQVLVIRLKVCSPDDFEKYFVFSSGEWVIVRSSQRHVFESHGVTGKHYRTALICISVGGFVLNPFFLYAGKHLMDSWCKGGPEGAQYAVTEKV